MDLSVLHTQMYLSTASRKEINRSLILWLIVVWFFIIHFTILSTVELNWKNMMRKSVTEEEYEQRNIIKSEIRKMCSKLFKRAQIDRLIDYGRYAGSLWEDKRTVITFVIRKHTLINIWQNRVYLLAINPIIWMQIG